MFHSIRRLIVGIAWVIVSYLVLCAVPSWIVYLVREFVLPNDFKVPGEGSDVHLFLAAGALLAVPCVTAVLALRGKLPGTRLPDPDDQMEDSEPPLNH
jgi:hypothetical protein